MNQFSDEQIGTWYLEALQIEDEYRDRLIFWKQVRVQLGNELEQREETREIVKQAERILDGGRGEGV